MTIYKSTVQLLRIPFSINLLPIFLFAVYSAFDHLVIWKAVLIFFLIHFVFYPASNAYNSYMDKDTGAIAGIKTPPAPTRQLYNTSIVLDATGLLLSSIISIPFMLINLGLVLLSRAYSWRGIRLKKYAILGFLMVSLSQGGISYFNMYQGIQSSGNILVFADEIWTRMLIASLLVGAIYPLTQIYQHEEDSKDGVQTISMLLGVRATFIFSGLLFLTSMFLLYATLAYIEFIIFILFMLPPILYFIYWASRTWMDTSKANFQNTMKMALGASIAMILAFGIILLIQIG